MIKSTMTLLAIGTVIGIIAAETAKTASEPETAIKTREYVVLRTMPISRSILRASKDILTKATVNQNYSAELNVVIDARKSLKQEKLRIVAALTRQYAAMKEKNASAETLTHIDEQRRRWVARYNEISRLLTLIAESKDQATQLDKVKQLVTFLEPPQVPQNTSLNRGTVTDTTPKNSTPKEQDKEKKK